MFQSYSDPTPDTWEPFQSANYGYHYNYDSDSSDSSNEGYKYA